MPNPNSERSRRPQDEDDEDDRNRPSGTDRGESMERARDEDSSVRQSTQDDDDMQRPEKDRETSDRPEKDRGAPSPGGSRGSGRGGSRPQTTRKKESSVPPGSPASPGGTLGPPPGFSSMGGRYTVAGAAVAISERCFGGVAADSETRALSRRHLRRGRNAGR